MVVSESKARYNVCTQGKGRARAERSKYPTHVGAAAAIAKRCLARTNHETEYTGW